MAVLIYPLLVFAGRVQMHKGYVNLWRKTKTSSVWLMPPLYQRVWDWMLMSVNHDTRTIPTPSGPIILQPGQRMTSMRQIADEVSWYEYGILKTPNTKTIKTILEWLEGNGQCTAESNAKGTVITIMNWSIYNTRGSVEVTQKEQPKVTPREQGADTNKNEKNEKKESLNQGNGKMLEICQAWKAFVEMRKLIKKPMTVYAMKLRIKDLMALAEQGHDPIAVLNQSVSANWQDLYAVKPSATTTQLNTTPNPAASTDYDCSKVDPRIRARLQHYGV